MANLRRRFGRDPRRRAPVGRGLENWHLQVCTRSASWCSTIISVPIPALWKIHGSFFVINLFAPACFSRLCGHTLLFYFFVVEGTLILTGTRAGWFSCWSAGRTLIPSSHITHARLATWLINILICFAAADAYPTRFCHYGAGSSCVRSLFAPAAAKIRSTFQWWGVPAETRRIVRYEAACRDTYLIRPRL